MDKRYSVFSSWLVRQTGLTLYDFRVLDLDDTSEEMVGLLFLEWTLTENPRGECIDRAIADMAHEGFYAIPREEVTP